MSNVTSQSNGNIRPDHHVMGRLTGTISRQCDSLDLSTSDLWSAMDEQQPIDKQAMLTPIKVNIVAMRDLLDKLEQFVSDVEDVQGEQEIPAHP